MDKKFKIQGREVNWYNLTDSEMLMLYKSDDTSEEDKDFLRKHIIDRYERVCCPNAGETNDELFARNFGDFVNGKMRSKRKVAEQMCRDHRYLQNEMFKVCLEYIKLLAENCEKGHYDPRNEWACKTSKFIIDSCKEGDVWI